MLGLPRSLYEPEHYKFGESVKDFCLRELVPHIARWEKQGYVDKEVWKKAAARGVIGFDIPTKYGGKGISDFRYNLMFSEISESFGVTDVLFQLSLDIINPYFIHLTNEEQKNRWLPGIARGELIPALAGTFASRYFFHVNLPP